jgi:peptidoglycan/LPS O-acetylase OafA/YrhL
MIWALLARFLTRQPPLIQAAVLGICAGLFVSTAAQANNRDPVIGTTVLQVVVVGLVAGALFYLGATRGGRDPQELVPRWLCFAYAIVWLAGLAAALLALFGNGGFKVAALAIVPLVLVAPAALQGIRRLTHRQPA